MQNMPEAGSMPLATSSLDSWSSHKLAVDCINLQQPAETPSSSLANSLQQ